MTVGAYLSLSIPNSSFLIPNFFLLVQKGKSQAGAFCVSPAVVITEKNKKRYCLRGQYIFELH